MRYIGMDAVTILNRIQTQNHSQSIVSVKRLHVFEVCTPDTDNDHAHWQARTADDRHLCLFHVRKNSVREEQQDLVRLWKGRDVKSDRKTRVSK